MSEQLTVKGLFQGESVQNRFQKLLGDKAHRITCQKNGKRASAQ